MTKVFTAHAVSVDGYITGRNPGTGRGLGDEVVLHQVPIRLGGGRPYFRSLPDHVQLRLVEAVPAPGVTHLHYEVTR